MRRVFAASFVLTMLAGLAPAASAGHTRAQAAPVGPVTLRLVDQSVSIVPDSVLRLVVRFVGTIPADADVVVLAHGAVTTRDELRAAAAGVVGPAVDRVTLVASEIPRTSEGFAEVLVPTTSGDLTVGQLRLATAGIHPLTVQVREVTATDAGERVAGELLGELRTFVHLEPPGGVRGTLEVAYVAQVSAHPTRRPDGGTTVDPSARRQLDDLVQLLERTSLPLSVSLAPELLDGFRRSTAEDQALLQRLDAALGDRELLVEPFVSIDPSGAARAGLVETYTRLLRLGEDTLADVLPRHPTRRSVQLVTGSIDAGGALLLRDLGMRSLVLLPSAQDQLGERLFDEVDPALLVEVGVGVDASLPAAIVDRELAQHLDDGDVDGDGDITMEAHLLAMELLALRTETVSLLGGGDPDIAAIALTGRSVTLATPSGRVGSPELIGRLLEVIQATPGLEAVTASVAAATTDTAIVDGLISTVPLPDEAGPDLDGLAERMFSLGVDAATIGSMLPVGDPRPAQWDQQMLVMPAQQLTAAELDAFEATVRDDLDTLRAAVNLPSVSDVTLGGRRSTIRIKLHNRADVPLTVVVRMESSKLSFPRGQELVTLPPDDVTEVEVFVEARTNGRFPVSVTVLTPLGDVPLHPPVEFAARVNALTGMGQLFSAAGVMILLTWWVHHLRRRRRERRAVTTAGAGPSTLGAP